VLLNIVAITNLNLVPVVAAGGLGTASLWVVALLFFFVPQAIAVTEFSARYPEEGGIYLWSKKQFGDFHGFLSGWCYWINNVCYIPTLLFYLVGISVYVGGERTLRLGDQPWFVFVFAVGSLWLMIALNLRGLGTGKWVHNLGGAGAWIVATTFILVGGWALLSHGSAEAITWKQFFVGRSDWKSLSAFGTICFGLVGLELASVMGDEIRNPKRDVPRAVVVAGVASGALYLASTVILLMTIPHQEVGVIQGVLQAISRMAGGVHQSWMTPVLALILASSIAGTASAWLVGSARIPFVAGLDRYLPAAFGKMHERWQTPYVALAVQGILSTAMVALSFSRAGVKEAYLTLLNVAVIIQLVPFLYLYAGLAKMAWRFAAGGAGGFYKSRWLLLSAGISGFLSTAAAMTLALIPSRDIQNVFLYEFKTLLGCFLLIGSAAAIFRWRTRSARITLAARGGGSANPTAQGKPLDPFSEE